MVTLIFFVHDPCCKSDSGCMSSVLTRSYINFMWRMDGHQLYYAHIYSNGTICDLTNEPREAEVRFECSEPCEMVMSVEELSTCKYALTIQCDQDFPIVQTMC
ncbi:hypothetical protein CTI12_AA354420 [Artemisia annua]|uniref:MRH domain-containing protein n=1 Tax=Artemisia annua TaxID=35608 RepID=A0A2U1LD97_ARTAN|nr:hypothetical protein CTI12_AA354420 [Artemisia annua]